MTSRPIPGLIINLATSTILSMIVIAAYNTADTYFVAKLGTSATGAVGVVFSVMALLQAIGFTFGTGAASIVSRRLGSNDIRRRKNCIYIFYCIALRHIISIFSLLYSGKFMLKSGLPKQFFLMPKTMQNTYS